MERKYYMKIKVEGLVNPIGLDVKNPRFSFVALVDNGALFQKSYSFTVADEEGNIVWDTGIVASDSSVNIEYAGEELLPYTHYIVKAEMTDDKGAVHCGEGFFETGRLDTEFKGDFITADFHTAMDFSAGEIQNRETPMLIVADEMGDIHEKIKRELELIRSGKKEETEFRRPLVFQQKFNYDGEVGSARIYISSMGIHYCWINGELADRCFFAPGWTSHTHELQYYSYDITGLLQKGENTVSIMVANGWYNRRIYWLLARDQKNFSNDIATIAYLRIKSTDGKVTEITTDKTWTYGFNGITDSGIYQGEHFDARISACCDKEVRLIEYPKDVLVGECSQRVRAVEKLPIKDIIITPEGDTVLDCGQNVAGVPMLKIEGKAGEVVELEFGEVLDKYGNFFANNYRSATCDYVYTLRDGYQEYYPLTTYYGFRYIRIKSFPGTVKKENFDILVLSTDMERTGFFSCGNADLNQLNNNILRSMKSNYIDIPSDCPQRDERLGWTGDAQEFSTTASFLYGVDPFFKKWLRDMAADQGEKGGVPNIVPFIRVWGDDKWRVEELTKLGYPDTKLGVDNVDWANFWGDAATICPNVMYDYFADTRILTDMLPCMSKWCDFLYEQMISPVGISKHGQLADWVGLDGEPGAYIGATPIDYSADACTLYSFKLTSRAAKIVGDIEKAEKYQKMYDEQIGIFREKYCNSKGVVEKTQASKIMAVVFDLVENKELQVKLLADQIKEDGYRLIVGFIGIRYILQVLSDYGYTDIAYKLLLRTQFPSWLYQVKKGATSVWEHLDGVTDDGSFWSMDMNSFNHYAYGSVGDWMYSRIGGIRLDRDHPGFKHFFIQPLPNTEIGHAESSYSSIHGLISTSWKIEDGKFSLDVEVPFNTSATVTLPSGKTMEVYAGKSSFSEPWIP